MFFVSNNPKFIFSKKSFLICFLLSFFTDCKLNCKICDSAITCNECLDDYKVFVKNSSCIKCEGTGYKVSGTFCQECLDNCESCNEKRECLKCRDGFLQINSTTCEKIIEITPEFNSTQFSNIFLFNLKEDANEFMSKITRSPKTYFNITVQGFQEKEMSYKLVDLSNSSFHFLFEFPRNVPEGTKITLDVKNETWMVQNTTRKILKFNFNSVFLKEYILCPENQIYNSSKDFYHKHR